MQVCASECPAGLLQCGRLKVPCSMCVDILERRYPGQSAPVTQGVPHCPPSALHHPHAPRATAGQSHRCRSCAGMTPARVGAPLHQDLIHVAIHCFHAQLFARPKQTYCKNPHLAALGAQARRRTQVRAAAICHEVGCQGCCICPCCKAPWLRSSTLPRACIASDRPPSKWAPQGDPKKPLL